jgi:DNA-binding NtrC family response regulator
MTSGKPVLLSVDDDRGIMEVEKKLLSADFEFFGAGSYIEGLAEFERVRPDIALLDMRLSEDVEDKGGILLLEKFLEINPGMPIVMISAYGDVREAVECVRKGATDFIKKPPDFSELKERLCRASDIARDKKQARQYSEHIRLEEPGQLVGQSEGIRDVLNRAKMAAEDGFATVLVTGETGTGKELVARAIHRMGRRSDWEFVPVAIPALSPAILEAELFGHEAGAFTGATARRIGFLEKANRGVLFLDEVGDLPEHVQLKLLRFLENRTFSRVGSSKEIKLDLQVVAATNADLLRQVATGKMRSDFYYRIRNIEIRIPPLRARVEDIPLLVDHFLGLFRQQNRTRVTALGDDALAAVIRYEWPGNVRELKGVLERAIIYANSHGHERIMLDDLPLDLTAQPAVRHATPLPQVRPGTALDLDSEMAMTELSCIEDALRAANERKAEAWVMLGLNDRFALRRRVASLLRKHPELASCFPVINKLYPSR